MPPGRRALLATALLAAGPAQAQRPTPAQSPRRLRDAAGREAVLPPRLTRIVAAGPPASIALWSLAPDLLAGWVRAPRGPELALLPPAAAALPEIGRLTGQAADTANLEAVLAGGAQLILDYGTVTPAYAALADRLQARTRLPVLLLDGRLAHIPDTFRRLGEILDRAAEAAPRIEAAERLLQTAQDMAARLAARGRPRVYYARGPDGLQTGAAGSIHTEVLEACGAENVASGSGGASGLLQVSAEHVLHWDPDWIVTPEPALAAAMPRHPIWGELRAVRQGRVALAPSLPFGWVDSPPSVNRLFGLLWLPALFGAQPRDVLPEQVATLSALLYHHRPDAAQLAALLRGALPPAG